MLRNSGLVPLENVFVRRRSDLKKKNCFEIYSSDGPLKMCKMYVCVCVCVCVRARASL